MNDGAPGRRRGEDEFEPVDDIDAAVEAVTNDHIASRFQRLLSDSVLAHLANPGLDGPSGPAAPAGPGNLHASDLGDLAAEIEAAERQLADVRSATHNAQLKHDNVAYRVGCANAELDRIRDRIAAESAAAADAYLDVVVARAQEILDGAHATARRIVDEAEREADRVPADARDQASVTGGRAPRRLRPH
jgi:hypothetical protein